MVRDEIRSIDVSTLYFNVLFHYEQQCLYKQSSVFLGNQLLLKVSPEYGNGGKLCKVRAKKTLCDFV